MKGFCCEAFFLLRQLRTVSYSVVAMLGKYLLVSKLNNAHIIRREFFRLQFSVDESCLIVWDLRGSLITQFLSMAISWTHFTW